MQRTYSQLQITGVIMLIEYIHAALEKARYEIIEDDEPYYGEVPELDGVWATGSTLEECRKNLEEVIDEWIVFRLRKGLSLPPIGSYSIEDYGEVAVA
jgi:predicted RNase H-like HicB family nuclease